MPDLHGWITRQVDETERIAEAARGQGEGRWIHNSTHPNGYVYDEHGQPVVYDESAPLPEEAAHIAFHDPATVLRRCAADRKILARHRLNPNAYWADAAMCEGCGTDGEMGYAVTENLNDCPELLDLAYAHGLTAEILAGLDRPQKGERPDYPGETGNLLHDSISSLYAELYKEVLEAGFAAFNKRHITGNGTGAPLGIRALADPPEPTPAERAFAVLEPHLRDVPLYRPKFAHGGILPEGFGATADRPPEMRDPHWRVHP